MMQWLDNFPFIINFVLPAFDVLLLAFIIYKSYKILVQSHAVQLIKGAFYVLLLYILALLLKLSTMLWILNLLAPSLVIALAIIFQPELRKIFTRIGQGRIWGSGESGAQFNLESIIEAAQVLAEQRRGALMVFARTVGLKNIIESGTSIDAEMSAPLLLTIFVYDTELHDGAVVVVDGRIKAAGCFLPLSLQPDVRRSFGTRHRAALGLAEESDAIVLAVSEESGALSLAYNANLYYNISLIEVRQRLVEQLQLRREMALEEEVQALE